MGTRGVFGVRVGGTDKMMYNQFDSYPDGLGQEVVEQVRGILKDNGLRWFKDRAENLRMVNEDSPPPTAAEKDLMRGYANLGVSNQSMDDWYCLFRELQHQLKGYLELGAMLSAEDFILDSLFCEYGYIANLDEQVFEVYQGFQKEKHKLGRYCDKKTDQSGYYPCALVATFPLEDIPDDWIKQLPGEDEDEEEDAA